MRHKIHLDYTHNLHKYVNLNHLFHLLYHFIIFIFLHNYHINKEKNCFPNNDKHLTYPNKNFLQFLLFI